MDELVAVKEAVSPHEILLVVDAMTGQDAVSPLVPVAQLDWTRGVARHQLHSCRAVVPLGIGVRSDFPGGSQSNNSDLCKSHTAH